MRRSFHLPLMLSLVSAASSALGAAGPEKADPTVSVTVESTLKTASDHIRQFVFDGDPNTYFASEENPTAADHLTLSFDKPVMIHSIVVASGRPNGDDKLDSGELQISTDGTKFETIADFSSGQAQYASKGRKAVAIRIKPSADMKHPLAIREITIDSGPQLAVFKYPVEFVLDVSDAPDMKEWGEQCVKICERQFTMINEALPSEGFKPAHVVYMKLKFRENDRSVAATGGNHITGSVTYFKRNPKDFGAMVHETVHVVQAYRGRRGATPGWLVEGIADYIRFFKYEPGKIGRLVNPEKLHYTDAYRTTARFLNYVTEKYDKDLVKKLNAALREGKYSDDLFQDITGKTVKDLDDEWRASLTG